MYPKIYLKNETDFAHNGLGFLKDVISCYVEEEHNSTFELEMTYRINGHLYEHLEKGNIIKAHASDRLKNQLFRIYKTIKKNENTIAVFAEHISYDLAHDTVKSLNIEMQSCEFALNSIFRQSDFCQHFTGYSDIQASGDYKMEQTDCLSAIVGQRGSIIDTFGNGAEILRDNFDIHVLNRRGKDQNVLIAYKKNMTGIEIEEDTTDLITRIYPFAKKTNEETNEEVVYTPTFGYIDSDKINYYEHPYSRFMDFSDKFEDGEEITDAKFRSICEKYFKDNKCDLPKTNYKIEFIPLAMTENYKDKYKVLEDVGLMDSVIIRDSRFNVDTEAKVVKTKYDVIREKYENIELGDPKTSLNDVIVGKPGADGKPGLDGADGADGKPGIDGIPGRPGEDGKTYYTWIRYADDEHGSGISDLPLGKEYIGIAYNKETPKESNNPKDYTWSKFKGDQGIPGAPGEDGVTLYTWIKYADDQFGNGMSDDSTNKEYIGIAYNQLSQQESTNPADYTWTKIKGDQGIPGRPGSDGVTLYTWVKYADDNLGTGMTDDPTGKAWLGLAFNKTTPQESNDYRDYTWSKIKGEDGQDGVDGDIGDFPDYLPDTPRITAKGFFGSIEVVWTYEAKVFLEYELYASQTRNFTPNTANLLFKGKASAFLHEVDCNQTWYYKVRAVNTHGNSTAFSAQASASTFKLDADNIENYIEELAIGHALIGSLDADKIVTGKLKATYLDTRELTVTDGNGNRTLYIDSYGRVYLNVTSLQVNSSDVATEQGVINKIEEAKKDTNKKIEQEVNDLNSTINDLNNYIEGAYRDGIITEAEKEALREHLKIVEREKDDITAQVEALKATVELRATAELNDLLRKQAEFDEAHTLFVNTIKQTIGLRRGNK